MYTFKKAFFIAMIMASSINAGTTYDTPVKKKKLSFENIISKKWQNDAMNYARMHIISICVRHLIASCTSIDPNDMTIRIASAGIMSAFMNRTASACLKDMAFAGFAGYSDALVLKGTTDVSEAIVKTIGLFLIRDLFLRSQFEQFWEKNVHKYI